MSHCPASPAVRLSYKEGQEQRSKAYLLVGLPYGEWWIAVCLPAQLYLKPQHQKILLGVRAVAACKIPKFAYGAECSTSR